MMTHSPTKNITFSAAGATLTCPHCGNQATYQIGQLDRDKWKKDEYTHGKWVCKDCHWKPVHHITTPPPVGHFPSLHKDEEPKEEKSDLDTFMELLE
jgi:predicted RNA-binding Zn-ribbon protein involved in translation (DUF1610 family)